MRLGVGNLKENNRNRLKPPSKVGRGASTYL
jgi:hypothetical protein